MWDKKRKNPQVVKSAHSYRRFPKDFFVGDVGSKPDLKLPQFEAKKSIDSEHAKNFKIIDKAKNGISPVALPNRGHLTDRMQKKLKAHSSMGRRESAATIQENWGVYKVYGEPEFGPKRSSTNHGWRSRNNGKVLSIINPII